MIFRYICTNNMNINLLNILLMKKIECIILLTFWFITCNAQTFIQSDSDSTVVTEYNDGKQWAYRKIKDFVVGLTSYESKDDYGKYYQINIFIQNQSDTSVTFDPEDVAARLINKKGDTLQLKVYTNEAFQKKIKKKSSMDYGSLWLFCRT